MKEIIVSYLDRPKLKAPVLVEGLPGVGNVGKMAAEHLISQLKARKFATIHSKHFPPQVLINDCGVIRLVSNDLYYSKRRGKQDIIILAGDYQGISQEGQYEISYEILDILQGLGGSRVYTLGGWSVGKLVAQPRVLGAATSEAVVKELKAAGVEFSRDEPAGGIVGAAGLLLGLGQIRGVEGACLMGETSGYFSDPKSARCVLEKLQALIGLDLDFTELEKQSKEIDSLTASINEAKPQSSRQDDLRYIG